MSPSYFPPLLDLDPEHTVDDNPEEVLDFVGAVFGNRTGLLIYSYDRQVYQMWVVRSYNLAGCDTLAPRFTPEKVGEVPWNIMVQDGYQQDTYTVEGFIRAESELGFYEDIAQLRDRFMSKPAVAFYSRENMQSGAFQKIPGVYRYVPGTFVPTWEWGHKNARWMRIQFQVEQVDQNSLVLDSEGNVIQLGLVQ